MSIQSMRDSSEGVIAKILVGLIIVVFALFGFGSITTYLAPVPKVATVNGEDVTQQDMEMAVERSRRLLRAQGQSVTDIDEDALRQEVLQSLIDRKLLSVAAEDLGLYVSDAVLDQDIVSTDAFQIDGVFSPEQFQMLIGGAGFTPLSYRAEMRVDKKLQQLATAIQGSAFFTPDEVKRSSALAQQTRDIAFLRIDVDGLLPDIDVSAEEIETYYANHPAEFMTEETVDLAYLELRRADMMDDVEVEEAELEAFYEQTKAIYSVAENRRVAHILVEANDEVSDEEAKVKIDGIYQRILEGESFADLAKAESDDPGSAEQGGDLGFTGPGSYVEEFENAAFGLDLNQMSEPVKTEFGYHLIKVLGIEAARVPDFAEVRNEVEEEFRAAQAEEMFVSRSVELSELAFEAGDLEGPAVDLGLEIKTTGPVSRDVTEGIAANEAVMDAAFSPDVLLDGNNSRLIEITPNHHVVVRVREHSPQEVRTLATVEADVRDILAREKATAIAEQQAQEIVEMLEDGSVTRFVADRFGLTWEVVAAAGRNQIGLERKINVEAFKLARPPEGTKSVGYTLLPDGDAAVISVTNVQNKPRSDVSDEELKSLGRILANQRGGFEYSEFRDNLAAMGEVTRVN